EKWAFKCGNEIENNRDRKEAAATNALYQNGLTTASALIEGSVQCEDQDIMRGLLKLGVSSLAMTASAGPHAMAAVAGGRLLNSLIDRFQNKNAKFIKDLTDRETVANFQCLQFFVNKKALRCDAQMINENLAGIKCELERDQLDNLAEIAKSIRNVSTLAAAEGQNQSSTLAAMTSLTDGILRQKGDRGGRALASFFKPENFSEADADVRDYFESLKAGKRFPADKMVLIAPKIMKVKSAIDSALSDGANIESLESAESYSRIAALTDPLPDLHSDSDASFLLAAHSKLTTSFREKFESILESHREEYDQNRGNKTARESMGMRLYQTCRLNAGAYLWGDEKGKRQSVSNPQNNAKFRSLCGEFLKCDAGNGKTI
ncbi:MAG: hypothetical protein V4692_13240, partial [Bdellovibrionota bacterium]